MQKSITLFEDPAAPVPISVDTDIPSIIANRSTAMVVTEVCCEVDAGTTTIMLQRDDGSPANLLSGNLTCNTEMGSGCTTSFSGSEASIAVGQNIDLALVTNASAKRINVTIKYTVP